MPEAWATSRERACLRRTEHPLPTSELCPPDPAQSWSVDTGLEPAFDSAAAAWCDACGWCPTRASDGAEGVVMVEELPEPLLGSYTKSTNTIVVSIVLR